MYSKETLLERQRRIQIAVLSLKPDSRRSSPEEFLYNTSRLSTLILFKEFNSRKSDENKLLSQLVTKLKELTGSLQNEQLFKIKRELFREFLIETCAPINRIISANQQEIAHTIFSFQAQIETAIQNYLIPGFKLPQRLSSGSISYEYNKAYDNEYGKGAIGFFKLPIKRMFQQKTRNEEIQFLEDVEQLCHKPAFIDEADRIKLTAINLVSMNIASETFGGGSILAKILKARLETAGYERDSSLFMEDAVTRFQRMGVRVPGHLVELYLGEFCSALKSSVYS